MEPNARTWTTAEILKLHEDLEIKYDDGGGGDFLFGWQSINPFAKELLDGVKRRSRNVDYTKYAYMESDKELANKVVRLHGDLDGVVPQAAFCAACGGTSVLFALCYWLCRSEIAEIYYIPPIYFTLLNGLRQFKIRARPLSRFHSFEKEFRLALPEKECVLFIADPVWYAGIPVPEQIIDEIAAWQHKTGSLVFVDGSFQYMRWDNVVYERTASLDPARTIRLVSPTKSLVVHGYRFAYALIPSEIKPRFSNSYTNICGSAAADNISFAYEAVEAMATRKLTNSLIYRASHRHKKLREAGVIESELSPCAGYFVFERVSTQTPDDNLKMEGQYFGQPRFPKYTRLNLLSTKFHFLESK
jgi:aspartate/methionine/tyrosine aminotransferase